MTRASTRFPTSRRPIHVAVSGAKSIALAARAGGGMVAVQPRSELTEAFDAAAGSGKPKYGQIAVCVDDDEGRARRVAHERFRFAAPGWKVMAELPNPINFEAATAHVREDDVAEMISCGPDLDRHADGDPAMDRRGIRPGRDRAGG